MQFNPIVKFFFMILEDSINSKFMRLLCPEKFSPGFLSSRLLLLSKFSYDANS